jgi:hypothetical protein
MQDHFSEINCIQQVEVKITSCNMVLNGDDNEIQVCFDRKNSLNCEISYFTTFYNLLSFLRYFSLFDMQMK